MKPNQLKELSRHLREMNELLENILHSQFGIEDKEWINAMQTLESGFSKSVNYIAKVKGRTTHYTTLTKENIDEILKD